MNPNDLWLQYLGGRIDLPTLKANIGNYLAGQTAYKGFSKDQLIAVINQTVTTLQATPLSTQEDNIVKNLQQQTISDAKANGAIANPQIDFPTYTTEAEANATAKTPSADTLLGLYKANPNGATKYQDVVNAYKTQQGLSDQQAADVVNNAIAGNLKGLDVNATAIAFDPRGKVPDVSKLTAAQIVNQVQNGAWHVEDAYNGLLELGGYTPASATAYLQQAKAAPPSWAPQAATAQPFASTNGIDPNAVARPATTGGSFGTGVRENLPYNGGPATMENLPFNPQTDSAQMQPLTAQSSKADLQAYAASVAQQFGIPQQAFLNLIGGESDWNPGADNDPTNPNAAKGLGQMIGSTAAGYGVTGEQLKADPALALKLSAQMLHDIATGTGGDYQKAMAQYYIGTGQDPRFGAVDWNAPNWQQQADAYATKLNAYYGSNGGATVSDFFASHNLTPDTFAPGGGATGPDGRTVAEITGTPYKSDAERTWYQQQIAAASSGTGAGSDTTGGVTGSTGTASTTGGWVTNPDGTTSYVPPTPKADLTPEQQLALNQQSTLATQGLLKNQQTSAVAAYKAQHPNATLYDLGKGDGSFKVEDPSAPQGAANTWTVQFDPSTGTMQEGGYAINPAVSTLSANGLFGNTQPNTGVLTPNQITNGTEATRALMAIDPAMAQASFQAAHNGRTGTDQEIQAWLGTSTGTNQSQDYADLQQNQATLAATGHTLQGYSAAAGGPGLNTPINLAKDLGGRPAGITPLNGRQQQIYANDPALLNTNGQADAYATGPNGEQYPVYSSIPYNPVNPTQGATIAAAIRGQGETGLGVSQSGNPLGVNSTGQPGDATFSANAAKVAGQAEQQAADSGGDISQSGEYQRGYADGQSAHTTALQASGGGTPTTVPNPQGSAAYVAGFRAGWGAGETARVQQVNNTYNDQFTKQYGGQDIGQNGVQTTRTQPQGSTLPTSGQPPEQNYSGGYTPPAPTPPPGPTINPQAPVSPVPIYRPPVFDNGGIMEIQRPSHVVDNSTGATVAGLAMNGAPETMSVTPMQSRPTVPMFRTTAAGKRIMDPARILDLMKV